MKKGRRISSTSLNFSNSFSLAGVKSTGHCKGLIGLSLGGVSGSAHPPRFACCAGDVVDLTRLLSSWMIMHRVL